MQIEAVQQSTGGDHHGSQKGQANRQADVPVDSPLGRSVNLSSCG
jgi:hypothetical protein